MHGEGNPAMHKYLLNHHDHGEGCCPGIGGAGISPGFTGAGGIFGCAAPSCDGRNGAGGMSPGFLSIIRISLA